MIEIWKAIGDYENMYEVSNLGNVRSLDRYITRSDNVKTFKSGKTLKPTLNYKGYCRIKLCRNGYSIHRLVAQTFIPNPENKPQVNHINGIKTDNRVENLEWCTNQENSNHANRLGLKNPRKGISNGMCKLSESQIKEIIELYTSGKYTQKEIASKYDITQTQISYICRGCGWEKITKNKENKPIKQKYNKENIKKTLLNRVKNKQKCAPISIQQIDLNTNEIINTFFSVKEAADSTNIPRTSIRAVISGTMKCTGNYIWKKIKQNINE